MNLFFTPPDRNCGACGVSRCDEFVILVKEGKKQETDCIFYNGREPPCAPDTIEHSFADIRGKAYDFIIAPFHGEISARKMVLPFRPDLVERWNIVRGDLVSGRPMGQGCPVPHFLEVIRANPVTGLLTCHAIGPLAARGRPCHPLEAYQVIGFEGRAVHIINEPAIGHRMSFLPSFCMLQIAHTGVVNQVIRSGEEMNVRVEDIRIV
ncbi:MAG: (Fe-S)-binding protein [Methanoregula sp.]|uniref:(Fe-S)-binding protein n=1 Tax=Methanoregula sp. TaxID=2052170 RepID=UPI003C22378F